MYSPNILVTIFTEFTLPCVCERSKIKVHHLQHTA